MKTLITLFFLSIILWSCSKNNSNPELLTSESDIFLPASILVCGFSQGEVYNGISIVNGMLKFQDTIQFRNTLACLEMQLDDHHDNFDSLYGHLTIAEIETIEDSIGFSDWKPLEDFEASFAFISRSSIIENAIIDWEIDSLQDIYNDPDDWDGWSDEMRTLLNSNMEFMIGDQVYNFDLSEVDSIGGNTITRHEHAECRWYGKKITRYKFDSDKRMIKLKTTFYDGLTQRKVKCKVVHYRRASGKYKRRRAPISAQISAETSDLNCRFLDYMGAVKSTKKRRWRRAVDRIWITTFQGRWKECSVHGSTNVDYGNYYFYHCNW